MKSDPTTLSVRQAGAILKKYKIVGTGKPLAWQGSTKVNFICPDKETTDRAVEAFRKEGYLVEFYMLHTEMIVPDWVVEARVDDRQDRSA